MSNERVSNEHRGGEGSPVAPVSRLVILTCAVALMSSACTSAPANSSVGTGGSGAGTGGTSGATGGAGGVPAGATGGAGGQDADGGAGQGGAGGITESCPEVPLLRGNTGDTAVELTFAPALDGKPFVFGEPNATEGGTVTPLNLRFYVSELVAIKTGGAVVALDLLTAAGAPEPFGVHLVNAEDAESMTVRTRVPAGTYEGFRFTFGITDACNAGPQTRGDPLSVNSQMTWPHVAGYLYLRYEALWTASDPNAAPPVMGPPAAVHMGGVIGHVFAPVVTIDGAFTVPTSGTISREVGMSFDEIFKAAASDLDVSDALLFPIFTPEMVAGERLRRQVEGLKVFSLAQP